MSTPPSPPGRAAPTPPPGGQVALLIDFENLVLGLRSSYDARVSYTFRLDPLLDLAAEYGHVVLANAYADWSHSLFSDLRHKVYRKGIDLIHVMGKSEVKNAVDVKMAVDAIEFLFTLPQIRTFIVVSGDRDFIHMVKTLRRYGRIIIGVSPESSRSRDFAELCDRFLTYHELMERYAHPVPAPEPAPAPEPPPPPAVSLIPPEWAELIDKLAKQYAFSLDREGRRDLLRKVHQTIQSIQPATWTQIEEQLPPTEDAALYRRLRRALEQVGALEPMPDQDKKILGRPSKRLARLGSTIQRDEDLILAYEAAVVGLATTEGPESARSPEALAVLLGYPPGDAEGDALVQALQARAAGPAPEIPLPAEEDGGIESPPEA